MRGNVAFRPLLFSSSKVDMKHSADLWTFGALRSAGIVLSRIFASYRACPHSSALS
jgi:hypothetical protein